MQLFHFHDCPTPNASPEQVPGYYDIITESMALYYLPDAIVPFSRLPNPKRLA
jgi:hypothetical protein